MPLTTLGILHTIVGTGSVFLIFYFLIVDKQILLSKRLGKLYLIGTFLTALSALGIYKNGEPNGAHALAVLTILAILAGVIASKVSFLGMIQKYFIALCFSSTLLFHMLPTATEILTRFPMDEPLATSSFDDPLLVITFRVILGLFILFIGLQMNWLRKQN
ncbi:MAG: hypothetical protein ACPGJI_04685 [Kangiellaceae bacterium]